MEERCDICGDVGVPEALLTCCQCKINAEHMYCMKTVLEERVNDWQCDKCESSSKPKPLSSCLLGDLTDVSKTNSFEIRKGGELRAESTKLLNESRVGASDWEKMAPTGKTKYICVNEAIRLSSGEKKYFPSSSITCHSKPPQHKSGTGRLDRAAIRPKTVLLNFSSHQNLASESLRPPKRQSPGNREICEKQLQQSLWLSKRQRPGTDELRSGSSLRLSEALKDTHKVKEQPSEVRLPVPSVNASPVIISGGDGHNNAIDSEKYLQVPALDALWKGSFRIQDAHVQAKTNHLVVAHPPSRVRKKIYEFSKQMPEVLHFKLVPSITFWNNLFNEHIPDKRDIALYFFPGVGESSEEDYIHLVEFISSTNWALRIQIKDVELLVFSSKLLPVNCQCWEGKYYLWGVFHRLKRGAVTPLENRALEMSVQPSDAVNHDKSQVSNCEDVDNVERMDLPVQREPLRRKCTGEEPTAAMALLTETMASAWRSNFAPVVTVPSPNVKIESNDHIPPGFEELYRLRIQSFSSSVDNVGDREVKEVRIGL